MSKIVASRKAEPGRHSTVDAISAWVAEGIITPAQAERIRAWEGAAPVSEPPHPSMMPLVIEALGYLGGAIVVVATMLIAGHYWKDLSDTARLLLLGGAAVLLLIGGAMVPARLEGLGTRMRAVVWLVSTGAVAGFLGVWGSQVAGWHDQDLALLVTGGTAVYAAALFLVRPSLLQQLAMMGLLGGTAAAALAKFVDTDAWPGVGVWVVGAAWMVLGQVKVLRPVEVARAGGAIMLLIGSMATASNGADAGLAFSLVTVAAIIALAVAFSDLVLLAIGALGAIQSIIAAVSEWFPNSLAAAIALLVVGAGLVGTAIWIARRRARPVGDPIRRHAAA